MNAHITSIQRFNYYHQSVAKKVTIANGTIALKTRFTQTMSFFSAYTGFKCSIQNRELVKVPLRIFKKMDLSIIVNDKWGHKMRRNDN